MQSTATVIDPAQYRSVMGHLPTGVVALSGFSPDHPHPCGLIVGTFQALSLDPPLVTFSVAATSTSWPKLRTAGRLCASVLAGGQETLTRALSSKRPDKFAAIDWSLSPFGSPGSRTRTRGSTARSPTSSTAVITSSSSLGCCTCRPAPASR